MSKGISVTIPDNVSAALERKMEKLSADQVPGLTVNKSRYVTTAITEKLLRDGEKVEAGKPNGKNKADAGTSTQDVGDLTE